MHEFLHFYLFIIFPGVYRNSKSSCINLQNLEKRDMGSPTSQKENNTDKKVPKLWRWLWCNCFTESVIPFFIITKKYHSFASKLKSWIDNSRNSWSRSSKLVAPLMSQQYSNEIKIPSSRMDMCYTSEAKPSPSWQPLFLTWIPHVVVWKLWITKRQCWCIFLFVRNHSVSIVLVMPGRFEAERRVSLLEKTTLRRQTVSYEQIKRQLRYDWISSCLYLFEQPIDIYKNLY
jgi:hypothetical protein